MISFFFQAEFLLHIHHIFIIHSSAEGHLSCFHFLAVGYRGLMNMAGQVSVEATPLGVLMLPLRSGNAVTETGIRNEKPPFELLVRRDQQIPNTM